MISFDKTVQESSMDFYEALAGYYDDIFEATDAEIAFLVKHAGDTDTRLLDAACGTGQHSVRLYELGYRDIDAVDLDPSMISRAKAKAAGVRFRVGDMLELSRYYTGRFGLIFCIGNSLAHLSGMPELNKFLKETYALLSPGGSVVFQTVNYDRILSGKISSLPDIKKNGLVFHRKYELLDKKVVFTGIIETGREKIEGSTELFAVTYTDLTGSMKETGFLDMESYGNFSGAGYDPGSSYSLVVSAVK
jgi:glycine/sarcosine N-methyltransferase